MLAKGEFDRTTDADGIEVWVTQMGPYENMNTAFIDRAEGIVALVDPFSAKNWIAALSEEGLKPTHILLTHTHRDHASGVKKIRAQYPNIEVWGHQDCAHRSLFSFAVFTKVDLTNSWSHKPHSQTEWKAGRIELVVSHTPGHAPGHVTFHGHGVYHAGDLLFTARSGRVDLPGGDPHAQWLSILHAREQLRQIDPQWRLIPGHRYDWVDGTTPDWVTIEQALAHNYSLNSKTLEEFDSLPFQRFDD